MRRRTPPGGLVQPPARLIRHDDLVAPHHVQQFPRPLIELVAIESALAHFRDRPVHLLWGMRDWVFTPRFLAEWQRRFPRASVARFERAGHYLFEDEPVAFVAELRRCLAD